MQVKPEDRYGRVTILREVAQRRNHERYFLCVCDCGKEWEVALSTLTAGETTSCGCLRRERFIDGLESHGQARTRLYFTWTSMKQRCLNEGHPSYGHYGGRGIAVCEEWLAFEPFYAWATASGYRDDLTIERVDNDGNYEPTNCAWIPQGQQSNNTRRTRMVAFRGERKNVAGWAAHLGINPDTICGRIYRGWDVERALATPVRSGGKGHGHD